METKKLVAAFVLIGIGSFMHLNTGWPAALVLQLVYCTMELVGIFILCVHLKSLLGKVAAILWLIGFSIGLLQGLEMSFFNLAYLLNPMQRYASEERIFGSWSQWMNVLLPFVSYICFLFYKPFFRLRAGWILLLLVSPFTCYFWNFIHLGNFVLRWGWVACFIAYIFFILQLFPAPGKERRRAFAFLWMFIGFVHSLNVLLNNDLKTILIAMAGTVAWLIGIFLLRSTGYRKKGTGAFIAYGLLMLFSLGAHLLLSFLPALLGDLVAFVLQLPACICAAVGFARFAGSDVFGNRECGMRTMSGVLVIACILTVVFLIPVVGETITSWSFILLLFPMMVVAWKNAFIAYPVGAIENAQIPTEKVNGTSAYQPPVPTPVYVPLSESEKREHKLREMPEEELQEIVRQRTRYSPDMREAATKELQRRRK